MKEEYIEGEKCWEAIIDYKSKERQYKYRSKTLRLYGGPVDSELQEIENTIAEIISENPGVTRDRIQISTETEPEEYESWSNGVLLFSYYTPETDEEMEDRIASLDRNLKDLEALILKYPEEGIRSC